MDGALSFLDASMVRKDHGTLKVTIYKKLTHTDQYLSKEGREIEMQCSISDKL